MLMRSRSRLAKTTKCPAKASGWRCSRTSACLIAAQAVLLGTHQGAVRVSVCRAFPAIETAKGTPKQWRLVLSVGRLVGIPE
jgi:hypothetical protein